MPLRDHFRPPVWTKSSWEGFHGGWPMVIVQRLDPILPDDFTAEPRVHLGTFYEIDVCAFEDDEPKSNFAPPEEGNGGVATKTWAPPTPTLSMDVDLSEQYDYEVLVFDQTRGRLLVAAVEIVCPANKDRPENRRAFVAKCSSLLQKGVCVSIVDLVTTRHFNLYAELMEMIGSTDPSFSPNPPSTYAVTCRGRKVENRTRFETWAYPLTVGKTLPTLPLWLSEDIAIPLDLESSYEETCKSLRIP